MAMAMMLFHFDEPFDQMQWRASLVKRVGRRRASERSVELEWSEDEQGGTLSMLTQDMIAMVYGGQLAIELGGRHMPLSFGEPQPPWRPPEWAKTPRIKLSWLKRFKLWLGPTKTYA